MDGPKKIIISNKLDKVKTISMVATGLEAKPYLKSITPWPKMRNVCLKGGSSNGLERDKFINNQSLQPRAGPDSPHSGQRVLDPDQLHIGQVDDPLLVFVVAFVDGMICRKWCLPS